MSAETTYNYKVVRQFAVMTVIWGIVGMLVGVIIAFGGCSLFAGGLAAFAFRGWQAVIVLAAVTLPLGITSGKEYA